jgi:anti-sigma B factor antagonist
VTASASRPTQYGVTQGLIVADESHGGVATIRLEGDVDMATIAPVRAALDRVLAGHCDRIVLDLRAVTFLDSSGINAIARAHARCEGRRRTFSVLVSGGPVERVLDICGMLAVLDHTAESARAA